MGRMTKNANHPTEPVATPRGLDHIVAGVSTSDGDGVKLTRVLQQPLQKRLDPYLMLDAFGSDNQGDYIGGFPNHPHRGFETVTYMIAGRMRHRDSAGHEGLLENGGVQWMTAGRGLVHSELPEQEEGLMEGFQLWLNLPAKDKMREPWYRDIQSEEIPEYTTAEGVHVRVIAGTSHGIEGAVLRAHTEPLYLDITLPPGAEFAQPLPADHNVLVYVFRESLWIAGSEVPTRRMAILANDASSDGVLLRAGATNHSPARALLIAGRPLHEPIAQYGPFVMNTQEEVKQAVHDFQNGQLG
ncbi:redox-sensitive bicupin YhaK (pirin superfamily) [Variovorax boronicumulans]|uniref:pirin family protein n=1 Tax=Variovorax TaxID=34072 RepID=UPI00278A2AC9|nr:MULTISPECIES: pirin family protein [Variovorax]MDQ0004551.1 redox-sensitive bicupin YhaK (pirin superfamily) [Variovorax boronicumulans]MDQ0611571.1 redox-sensitive bicupin YhaK (pirin superfamily) [Variovorax sp. W1I1]